MLNKNEAWLRVKKLLPDYVASSAIELEKYFAFSVRLVNAPPYSPTGLTVLLVDKRTGKVEETLATDPRTIISPMFKLLDPTEFI